MARKGRLTGKVRQLAIIVVVMLLAVSIALIIMFGGVFPESSEALTTREVLQNSEQFIGKNITVQGYYYNGGTISGEGYITPVSIELPFEQGEYEEQWFLPINHSTVDIVLSNDVLYQFTGTLRAEESEIGSFNPVMLHAKEIITII